MMTNYSINKTNTNILKHFAMLNNPIKTRLCPFTNLAFRAHRNNQRFSTPEARKSYHNLINNSLRKKLSFINKQLLKNYKIADAFKRSAFVAILAGVADDVPHAQVIFIGKQHGFINRCFADATCREINDSF